MWVETGSHYHFTIINYCNRLYLNIYDIYMHNKRHQFIYFQDWIEGCRVLISFLLEHFNYKVKGNEKFIQAKP